VRILVFAMALLATAGACTSQESRLPQPGGDYPVGTTYLVFLDETREELFNDQAGDHREITARAWYPGEATEKARTAPYFENAEAFVARFGYSEVFLGLETNSRLDVPVSGRKDKYPVVLFNHGWGEHAAQNTILMENFASHGYVVISLAHHYEAKYWAYPDGRLEYIDTASSRFQSIMEEQNKPGIMEMFQAMFTTRGAAAQESLFRNTVRAMPTFLGESARMWADDISFVIDRLDSLNRAEGLFMGKLDLGRIGVMGMSMGGAAAAQACVGDDRITAAMNIDGGLLGDLPDTSVAQPIFFMNSRRFIDYEDVFAAHARGDIYILTIRDADHYDFTDLTLLHHEHPMMGTVDGMRMIDIMNDYTLAFFDLYLKGEKPRILTEEERPFPEAELRVYKRS
jgi:dienelactone hydrolase